jgi:hypothetical protein
MEPFIRSDQFNYIRTQTKILINAHSTSSDPKILAAVKELSLEKVYNLFTDLHEEQKELLRPLSEIKTDADWFLAILRPYVIPFKELTEQTIKKLFPKAKKLKAPSLDHVDTREISYLSWIDHGSGKKFIVAPFDDKLIGLQGNYKPINQKGICTVCNGYEELGLFTTEKKGTVLGTYTSRGNYICEDSLKCNHNLIKLDRLHDFIELVSK